MDETPLRYAVLLKGPALPEPPKFAPVLAAHRRIPLLDAARLARGTWGLVGDGMEESEAKELASKLEAAGIGALALPDNLMEDLPASVPVHRIEFSGNGVCLHPKSGPGAMVLWGRIALIASAGYKQATAKTVRVEEGPSAAQKAGGMALGMILTGLPIPLGGGRKTEARKVQEEVELVYRLELFERKPLRRWRVDAQGLNYSCLGGRMQYGVEANFRTLMELIVGGAPGALRTRGTRVLAERAPVNTMGYDSAADLERESRWLLTLEALRDP